MGSAIETLVNREYPYGFVTDVETDTIGRGLNEDVIRVISQKKNEPSSCSLGGSRHIAAGSR
jgi:Fe-S cluster assembly protein SufB